MNFLSEQFKHLDLVRVPPCFELYVSGLQVFSPCTTHISSVCLLLITLSNLHAPLLVSTTEYLRTGCLLYRLRFIIYLESWRILEYSSSQILRSSNKLSTTYHEQINLRVFLSRPISQVAILTFDVTSLSGRS